MTHELRIEEPLADALGDGRLTFDVRLNDRGYNAGDTVMYMVCDSMGVQILWHPLHKTMWRITYVLSGNGIKEGYVVFGITRMHEGEVS